MKEKDKNNFKVMLKYFNNSKLLLFILALLMLMSGIFNIFNPIVTAKLVTYITKVNITKAFIYTGIFLLLAIVNILFTKYINIVFLKIRSKVLFNVRKDMVKSIFNMKTKNFDEHPSGEFSERLKNDPEAIMGLLAGVQYSLFTMFTDLIILVYVFFLNYIIGIIYTLCVILVFFYEKYAYKRYEDIKKDCSDINDKNSTLLNEMTRGIRDIKILNLHKKLYNNICKQLDFSAELYNKSEIEYYGIYNTTELIKNMATIIVIFIGIYLVSIKSLTVTNLLIIFMYRTYIYDLVLAYTSINQHLTNFKVSAERILELFNNRKFEKEKFGKKELNDIKGKIEIKNLSFSYNDKKILNEIKFKIKPNETIAIVGASGSGKTTILNLLCKQYDVSDNKIFIDDIDINKLSKDSIRNNISLISQQPYIFNLSIKDNLQLVGDDISEKDMIDACKIAQIHNFIEKLPDKYDTILGENGMNLSGGQKQRLAIARALLRKSKIILFDEATSALDNITQRDLNKAINNLSNNYTMIVVAHRLSTIKNCSKIYVIDDGRVVGSGTHEDLLNSNEYYKKLYLQELD